MATLFGMAYNFAPASSPAPFFMGLYHTSSRKHLHISKAFGDLHLVPSTCGLDSHAAAAGNGKPLLHFFSQPLSFLPWKPCDEPAHSRIRSPGVRAHSVACNKTTTFSAFQKLKQLGGLNVSHFCHTFIPLSGTALLVPLPKTPFLFPAQSVFRSWLKHHTFPLSSDWLHIAYLYYSA